MWTRQLRGRTWLLLMCLLVEVALPADEAPRQKSGLYDGAVGVKRDAIVDQSQACLNPSTMEGAPLTDVLKRVEELTHLQVWTDRQAFEDAGIDLKNDTIMTVWSAGETIAQLTNHLYETTGVEFGWTVHDGVATLTTIENADQTYTTKQYPIGDQLAVERDPRMLINLLQSETSGPWDADEPGTGTLSLFNNLLYVRQSHRLQKEVADVLAGLRRKEPIVLLNCSDEELRLRRLLEERLVNLEFPDNTLGEVVNLLAETTGARIRLDVRELADAGVSAETRLETIILEGIPLGAALKLSLRDVGGVELAAYVCHEECRVTTLEKLNQQYETVLYRIGAWGITGGDVDEFAALLQLETSGPWDDDEPGTGTISVLESLGVLAVRQTQPVHREILEILRNLPSQSISHQTVRVDHSVSHPFVPADAARAASEAVVSPAQLLPQPLTAKPWGGTQVDTPLLLALIVGCATGYVGRHWGSRS